MRKLEEKDLQTRVDWINDPRIHSTMNIATPVTLESTIEWFKRSTNNKNRVDVVLERNSQIVAMAGLYDKKHGSAEVYLFVCPVLKRQRIGEKVVFMLGAWGANKLRLSELTSTIDKNNIASRRLFEKSNYKLLEIKKGELEKQGKLIDRCYYSLTENDFDFSQFNYSIDNGNIEIEIYE